MALIFPNQSRSFDSAKQCIRFVGHDNVFEIGFCLEIKRSSKLTSSRFVLNRGILLFLTRRVMLSNALRKELIIKEKTQ